MFLDKSLILSDAQAITGSTSEIVSTNVIDMKAAGDASDEMYAVIQIETACATSGTQAASVTFKVQTSVDEAFTSPIELYTTSAIAKATLVDKYRVVAIRLPKGVKRYLRATYTPATTNLSTGKVDTFLCMNVDTKS